MAAVYALEFDGNDQAKCTTSGQSALGTMTIEAWLKPANGMTTGSQIAFTDNLNECFHLGGGWSSGKFGAYISTVDQGFQRVDSTTSVVAGTLYHIAETYDKDAGANNIKLWINGVNEASGTATGVIAATRAYALGDFSIALQGFSGVIDEVRHSNIVRYTEAFTPSTAPFEVDANTLALWHLDEGTGTTAYDATDNNADLALQADPKDPVWVEGYIKISGSNDLLFHHL